MNAVEEKLDPDLFYRIHRSHIVNIERVRELQPRSTVSIWSALRAGALDAQPRLPGELAGAHRPHPVARTSPPVHFVHPIDHAFLPSRSPCAKSIAGCRHQAVRCAPAPVSSCARVSPPLQHAGRACRIGEHRRGDAEQFAAWLCTQCRHLSSAMNEPPPEYAVADSPVMQKRMGAKQHVPALPVPRRPRGRQRGAVSSDTRRRRGRATHCL